ncbi:hypothetical protein MANES_08G172801v8 [Manihot esculenta]|uniref:Uncharacterized protein n=1 Tax=Manihot esculenta TaxID=3983 RepID=A0ACB7HBC5_MANES|nr:hypothetical protein MANES_08G172801v8 [Manihot esculenta]
MTKEIRVALESCLLCFLLLLFARALSKSNIHLGYSATLSIPLNTARQTNFKAALSVEAIDRKYSCSLEVFLGDVKLKGYQEQVGRRNGTFGQGVERLKILGTAIQQVLILPNSTQQDCALYLNSGKRSYSYWLFKPSKKRNITFVELGSQGPGNKTENLELYFYSPDKLSLEAEFQALNTTLLGSCIRFVTKENGLDWDCSNGISGGFCGKVAASLNTSMEACEKFCLEDCKCVAALYSSGESRECYLYGAVMGVKQVERGTGSTCMAKVPKGTHVERRNIPTKPAPVNSDSMFV